MEVQGFFREDTERDLLVLTRLLWIVSRYWMDYLNELESLEEIRWRDQVRGIEHHFAILLPSPTREAGEAFRQSLARAQRTAA